MSSSGGSISAWIGGRPGAVVLAVVALAAGALAVPVVTGDGGGTPTPTPTATATPGAGVANIWIEPGGGPCAGGRSATPISYAAAVSPDRICGAFDPAWDAMTAGDTARCLPGAYGWQEITGDKASETRIVCDAGAVVTGLAECRAEYGGASAFCMEGDHLTLENVTITATDVSIGSCSRIWSDTTDVTWVNVRCHGGEPFVYVEGARFSWLGGELGEDDDGLPRITCTRFSEPLWLAGGSSHVIDGVRFRKRLIQATATPNVGSCGGDGLPHLETIRFESGTSNVTIRNSRFDDGSDAGSGHIFASVAVAGLTLANNYFGAVNGTYWTQTVGANSGWKVLYNTFRQSSSHSGSGETWVGNFGADQGCAGTHVKNVWSGTGSCAGDTFLGATSLGLSADGHLQAGSPAIDAAEALGGIYCAGAAVGSRDIDGDTRPQGSACDAGADERMGG